MTEHTIGTRFGRWTVVGESYTDPRLKHNRYVPCRCDCGAEKAVSVASLRGDSPGCRACYLESRRRPGPRPSRPEYAAWRHMVKRCYDSTDRNFPRYGGRGITVCEEWKASFAAFFAHIGKRPSALHSIDRIDNDGNYEPGNVRWATAREQARNRRTSRLVTAFGRTQTLAEWAEESGLSLSLIHARIGRLGWPAEIAVTRAADGTWARP